MKWNSISIYIIYFLICSLLYFWLSLIFNGFLCKINIPRYFICWFCSSFIFKCFQHWFWG